MAWRCSGASNAELVANLKRKGIFHSDRVMQAMSSVDRANYVLRKDDAYEDSPQPIGHSATISAPHMHAYAAEHLLPYLHPGARVLDIGSGSGYLTAVLHHLVSPPGGPQGLVVGIDHIPALVQASIENLKADGLGEALEAADASSSSSSSPAAEDKDKHSVTGIKMLAADGREGYAPLGPYDAIHVGAAAPTVPPALLDQLKAPGRMFIPVGEWEQWIEQVDKDERGHVRKTRVMGVRYVPLTDRDNTFRARN